MQNLLLIRKDIYIENRGTFYLRKYFQEFVLMKVLSPDAIKHHDCFRIHIQLSTDENRNAKNAS